MGVGKIAIGLFVIVLGVVIWSMLSSPEGAITQLLYASPSARYDFSQTVQSLKAIYFLLVSGTGIGLIIWGSQS